MARAQTLKFDASGDKAKTKNELMSKLGMDDDVGVMDSKLDDDGDDLLGLMDAAGK